MEAFAKKEEIMNIRWITVPVIAALLSAAAFVTFAENAKERGIAELFESGELLSQVRL